MREPRRKIQDQPSSISLYATERDKLHSYHRELVKSVHSSLVLINGGGILGLIQLISKLTISYRLIAFSTASFVIGLSCAIFAVLTAIIDNESMDESLMRMMNKQIVDRGAGPAALPSRLKGSAYYISFLTTGLAAVMFVLGGLTALYGLSAGRPLAANEIPVQIVMAPAMIESKPSQTAKVALPRPTAEHPGPPPHE